MIKLLHKQLPLNIVSQYVELNNIDNKEMTKILRNTLTDKGELSIQIIYEKKSYLTISNVCRDG